MTLKTARRLLAILPMLALTALTACEDIDEQEGDCRAVYRLSFRYDMNMLGADAFASHVKSIAVCLYDSDDKLVAMQTEEGDTLATAGYRMTLRGIQAGQYSVVAWANLADGTRYRLNGCQPGSPITDMTLTLAHDANAQQQSTITDDIQDGGPLFHGRLDNITLPQHEGTFDYCVPLTRTTNTIRILLQHLSGDEVRPQDFDITLTDRNLTYDACHRPSGLVVYSPWSVQSGSAALDRQSAPRKAQTSLSALVAELSVGRLMDYSQCTLSIRRHADGGEIVRLPLTDYMLMVKGNYNRSMTDQEYLDRQSDYNITLFLDDDNRWMNAYIFINSWKVVLINADL